MENNFNLKSFLAEGKLLKEEFTVQITVDANKMKHIKLSEQFLNEKAAMEILNVNDNRFNYRVEAEDFDRIEQGYLPIKIIASGAGAILQGKEEYYDDVTRYSFSPTYKLKKKYRNTIFKGLTHQFPFESIFDENGMNKGLGNYVNKLKS